jgi:hypothetical protein
MHCYTPRGTNQYCVTNMLYDKDPLSSFAFGSIDMYPTSTAGLKPARRATSSLTALHSLTP